MNLETRQSGWRWETWVGAGGLGLLLVGCYIGLFIAPPERHMGDVQRIFYVHVTTAKIALLVCTVAFFLAIVSLWTRKRKWDALMVGAVEAGSVLIALLLAQGMLWAKPTWGVWWDWDVRLTTSLVLLLLFAGVLALRGFIDDPARRQSWSAIATIVAFVDVPLVYFCVQWWRSLHQIQSSPETVSSAMVLPLRINLTGMLALSIYFVIRRARIELARQRREDVAPPERVAMAEATEEASHA